MTQKHYLTMEEISVAIAGLAVLVLQRYPQGKWLKCYGVPRGGVPVALALQQRLEHMTLVDDPAHADFIVDDIIDSGATALKFAGKPFYALIGKTVIAKQDCPPGSFMGSMVEYVRGVPRGEWIVFPWEGDSLGSGEDIVTRLLQFIGEDPTRGGLAETPARVLKAWSEWTAGYAQDPKDILKTFEDGAKNVDEIVMVRDIPLWSHCEHHLAPFFGHAHIAYIPDGKIVGLSKLARLVDVFGRRLQVQERMTNQIADAMQDHLTPKAIGVVLEARHMCMESRGIRRTGATTVTSAMRGAFLNKPEARAEFFAILARR